MCLSAKLRWQLINNFYVLFFVNYKSTTLTLSTLHFPNDLILLIFFIYFYCTSAGRCGRAGRKGLVTAIIAKRDKILSDAIQVLYSTLKYSTIPYSVQFSLINEYISIQFMYGIHVPVLLRHNNSMNKIRTSHIAVF